MTEITRKSVSFIITVLALIVLSPNTQPQNRVSTPNDQAGPGLSETIEWLRGKTDEIVAVYPLWLSSGETIESVGDDSLTSRGGIVSESTSNCNFGWQVVETKRETPITLAPDAQSKSKKQDKPKNRPSGLIVYSSPVFQATSVSFQFPEINPTRFVVTKQYHRRSRYQINIGVPEREEEWWVKLYTTDRKKTIRWQSVDRVQESSGIVVAFRTEEMAQRFAKALTHSVRLCGGRPDHKEPF